MQEPLNEYVASNYGLILSDLGLTHVSHFKDDEFFGNEIDRFRNHRIIIDFIQDRGTKYVRITPPEQINDHFDLTYLLAMLEPQETPHDVSACVALLPRLAPKLWALFIAKQYACYRRAYLSFENCKNFWEIGPGDECGKRRPTGIVDAETWLEGLLRAREEHRNDSSH